MDKILSEINERVFASALEGSEKKELVNLNSTIAGAVKRLEHAGADSIILRMDELSCVVAIAAQLQEAFRLLFGFMLAQLPLPQKIYCYVKGVTQEVTLLDHKSESRIFGLEIHTSAQAAENGSEEHLLRAASLFINNKIGFEYKKAQTSGMLFLLNIQGCATGA